jgi:hypothetical protein
LRARWLTYWKQNPIAAWTGRNPRAWFRIDDGRFRLDLDVAPELAAPLHRLTRELVDYRLAQYRDRRRRDQPTDAGFVCKILSNQRDPIVKLPRRDRAQIPRGETDVRLPDGAVWRFRFAKFCNVRPAGTSATTSDLLRGWFGPRAGQPGTAFQIRFHAAPGGLWVEPVQAEIVELASRRKIVAYPGCAPPLVTPGAMSSPGRSWCRAVQDADQTCSRCASRERRWTAEAAAARRRLGRDAAGAQHAGGAVEGRVVLVQVEGDAHGAGYQIKH